MIKTGQRYKNVDVTFGRQNNKRQIKESEEGESEISVPTDGYCMFDIKNSLVFVIFR